MERAKSYYARHTKGVKVTSPDGSVKEYETQTLASQAVNIPLWVVRKSIKDKEPVNGYRFMNLEDPSRAL